MLLTITVIFLLNHEWLILGFDIALTLIYFCGNCWLKDPSHLKFILLVKIFKNY